MLISISMKTLERWEASQKEFQNQKVSPCHYSIYASFYSIFIAAARHYSGVTPRHGLFDSRFLRQLLLCRFSFCLINALNEKSIVVFCSEIWDITPIMCVLVAIRRQSKTTLRELVRGISKMGAFCHKST